MTNKSEQAFLRSLFLLAFMEPESFNNSSGSHETAELNECDGEISECEEMLRYFIETKNNEEITAWKHYLQEAKTRKRMIRKMIDTNQNERDLLTI